MMFKQLNYDEKYDVLCERFGEDNIGSIDEFYLKFSDALPDFAQKNFEWTYEGLWNTGFETFYFMCIALIIEYESLYELMLSSNGKSFVTEKEYERKKDELGLPFCMAYRYRY